MRRHSRFLTDWWLSVLAGLLGAGLLATASHASIVERHVELTTVHGDMLIGEFVGSHDGDYHLNANSLTSWQFTFQPAGSGSQGAFTLDQTNSVVRLFGYDAQENTLTPTVFPLLLITGSDGQLQSMFGRYLAVHAPESGFTLGKLAGDPVITPLQSSPSEGEDPEPPKDDHPKGDDPKDDPSPAPPVVPEPASFLVWSTLMLGGGGLALMRRCGRVH